MIYWSNIIFILFLLLGPSDGEAQVCRKGIPCGNSCIAAWKTCRVGRGSAVHVSEVKEGGLREFSDKSNVIERSGDKGPAAESFDKGRTYTLRSFGLTFFLCNTSDGKILKCNGYCGGLSEATPGLKLDFFDGFKIVEFKSSDWTPISCDIGGCREIQK